MSYFQGFVVPVPGDKKQAYIDMATKAAPVFAEFGATRTVECWEEEVPDGKRTDLRRAVAAEPGEKIVFSWITWPDKATCDAAAEKIMADDRMPSGDMPFNPQRMIYAGYEPVFEQSDSKAAAGYIDGVVGPAPGDGRDAFTAQSHALDSFFLKQGALRVMDGWGVDVPDGKVTDFKRAVAAEEGEQVIFGWIEWPDKATRDAAFGKMMSDPEMQKIKPGFDMQRAIFGGFTPVLDTDRA
ncbi:MAG: DUF1428 domain-containing protein [Sphingomonas sp.]